MSDPDLAVIIVTYKCAPLTVEALRSVAAERLHSGLPIRAIVVDNASGDLGTIAKAVSDNSWLEWVTLLEAPRNGGFAFGNNLGINRAYEDGIPDYLHLLNPDAQLRPGAITALVRFMDAHPEVGIAGSSFENLDGSEWPIAFRFPSLFSEVDAGLNFGLATTLLRPWVVPRIMAHTPEPVDWVIGASMMVRPKVLAAIGGLDENYFLYFEETDFCWRARRAGYSTWYVPQSRVMHIMGQSTGVTDQRQGPKRLPRYWFESRRRYYAVTFGIPWAMLIDVAALVANVLGLAKRLALGRRHSAVPHFIRDLLCHSILRRRNRRVPPFDASIMPQD